MKFSENESNDEAPWPNGEYFCLIAESHEDIACAIMLANFAVKHGWNAVTTADGIEGEVILPKKVFFVPRAAKPV